MTTMINDSLDYNALITWKSPPKKCIELNNDSVSRIVVASTQQNNVDSQSNNLHPQDTTSKLMTHYATIQDNQISTQHGMIISHISNNLNGSTHMQQFKPNENIHIQQVLPISTQDVHIQSDQLNTKNNLLKEKSPVVKKKVKKVPVDGIAFHSKQLGLKVPPKKTLGIKGKVINKQTREVIHNVYKFMKDEARNGTKIPLANYRERVLAATGISKCTYSKITSKEFINGVLVEGFTPSKKIRKDVQMTENAIDQSADEISSVYRPKINRAASTRDDIYNLEDLVPSYILKTLEPEAINIMNTYDIGNFGDFVASNIGAILRSGVPQEIMKFRITIFLYIEYLIKFINTPMKNVTKKFTICDKSSEVNNHILSTFSVISPSGRTRPVHIKDKSLCFILILTAKAMDYEVDLTNLAKDCKIGVKKALEISRILAFNSSSKNKNVVTLILPLPAPVPVTHKKRK